MPILSSSNSTANKDMSTQFSDQVENIAGKEEILASHEQFFLFQQCFRNLSFADTLK